MPFFEFDRNFGCDVATFSSRPIYIYTYTYILFAVELEPLDGWETIMAAVRGLRAGNALTGPPFRHSQVNQPIVTTTGYL